MIFKPDLDNIIRDSRQMPLYETPRGILIQGDSLEVIKKFSDHSVSLIITDPPYHTTRKKNIYGDTAFKKDEQYLEWMALYSKEWARILKPNGSLFCFCSPSMSGRLENVFAGEFNILSQIVWTKPNEPGFDGWKQKMKKTALRRWYAHSERIIFAEPTNHENPHRSYFGDLLRNYRKEAYLTCKDLTEMIGAYGKVNHGGAVSNWEAGRNVPSKEQYEKIRKAIKEVSDQNMPDYEDVYSLLIRPFFVDETKEFTDIWTFPNIRPYDGKHPAEKPVALLEHAITATTYPDDIVLDCFAGSGSTAAATMKLGRYSISIEIEDKWCKKIIRLLERIQAKNYSVFPDNYNRKSMMANNYQERLL